MHVKLRLDGDNLRQWHVQLLHRLAAQPDIEISIDDAPAPHQALPANAILLFRLEALIHRLSRSGPASVAARGALASYGRRGGTPDLVIDLCGDVTDNKARVWQLRFNGAPGETALLGCLLGGGAPVATINDGPKCLAIGRLGTESQGVMLASFEDALARTATLILSALAGTAGDTLPALPGEPATTGAVAPVTTSALGARAAKEVTRSVIRHLYRLGFDSPHWRVGWRKLDGADLIASRQHPESGWHDLPDDGRRFYADPFLVEANGTTMLFVEDYHHRLGKGIISAVAFNAHGPVGTPEPVLELPYHLSYPFVFERDGVMWMIPESCATNTIDLFRATKYPGGWVQEATLVSGVAASDATLLQHNGRWWLLATVKDHGGSFSDALYLWSAPDFRGPWTPHRRNPVLIDIASARPAGRIVERDGALFRPIQDCRRGYGAALGLARITQLDDDGFAQTVETILTPGEKWPGSRLHTLNSGGGFEVIDGSGRALRWHLPQR